MRLLLLILLLCCTLISCSKSNEAYRNEAEENLSHLLIHGTEKAQILDFLHKNHYQFTEISQAQCQKYPTKQDEHCTKGGYIALKQTFKKWLNPVQSGAYLRLNFDESGKLESHQTTINHSFL